MSVYKVRDILLDYFANLKLNITVVQYLTISRERQDFLVKGLKEIEAPEVHRSKADSRTAIDINTLSQVGLVLKEKPQKYIDRKEELIGNRERRVYSSLYIPVTIFGEKRSIKLAAIIDLGAAINIISRTLYNHLGFEIQDISEYNIHPIQGLMLGLNSIVNNVPVLIGGISFRVSFFIISRANHHCILGQPFKIISRIRLYSTTKGIDSLEFTKLYNNRRQKIIRIQYTQPIQHKVTLVKELLRTDYKFNSDSSGKENQILA